MIAWMSRNTRPILFVIFASAIVIGVFEGLDAIAGSPSTAINIEDAGDSAPVPVLASLIKFVAFLAIGMGIAKLIRRRIRPDSKA